MLLILVPILRVIDEPLTFKSLISTTASPPASRWGATGEPLPLDKLNGAFFTDLEPKILAEHDEWLRYDLPEHLIGKVWGGRWRGQEQRWFALRFTGQDSDIRLDADAHQEFDAWRWARLEELPGLAVPFKRPIYEALTRAFARFAG